MRKRAEVQFPIHHLLAERWSPRAFSSRPVARELLGSLFEAARWAPSCYNDQPWFFVVATQDDAAGFERLAACLVEGNAWAKAAPVLILSVARETFGHNGKPNRHAQHDVGLAVENLVTQAEALDLRVHQMAGYDAEKARTTLGIPEGFVPMAMIAVGHPGDPDTLPAALAERERAPRTRKELRSFVFGAGWEQAFPTLFEKP